MAEKKKTKMIVTLGPATRSEAQLRKIKEKGVDFVRINMSHSSIEDLQYFIDLSKKVGIPFIIDTEGSQIRTGDLSQKEISLHENDIVKLYVQPIEGNEKEISIRPAPILKQLEPGDLLHIDFDSLILRISDCSTLSQGYIISQVVASGTLGRNKGMVVDSAMEKVFNLPPLSDKDYQSIDLGLSAGVKYIAASFMRSGEFVDEVRRATRGSMKIISKIECMDALHALDEIIDASDYILIDRGDLSKEIPLEKIPFAQKIILEKAHALKKGAFVATNLLESMIWRRRPTRAEVHDVITTIRDGADVVLSAETAIGKYPMESITMMKTLIRQSSGMPDDFTFRNIEKDFIDHLGMINYLFDTTTFSPLVKPHGGTLVNRFISKIPSLEELDSFENIKLDSNLQMDVEQIALGTFSPLEGFMGKKDFEGVLDNMKLANGIVWTIPIILDVTEEQASRISIGDTVALEGDDGVMALLHVDDTFTFDKTTTAEKLFGTTNRDHPGVAKIYSLNPILLGGTIDLIKRRVSDNKEYELSPKQVRRLFEERGWSRVVGFHTRNVIHRSHEFIQKQALEKENCDGLFIHPVVGKKKVGDFNSQYITHSYEQMIEHFYPKDKVVFATYATFSRYAGPREAVFTALCRKNFGCSHFIVGRDHTGVGDFYSPHASHKIFDMLPDLGITAIKFDKVSYSPSLKEYIHETDYPNHPEDDKLHISGTQAREMLEKGEMPPEWFMRPEIAQIMVDAIKKGEAVFVKDS